MKRKSLIFALLAAACLSHAQVEKWNHPCVGYSNTSVMTIEDIEFSPKATVLHAAVDGHGNMYRLSSGSYISADGKRYQVRKASGVKFDKDFKTPTKGKVRFTLIFDPVPADVKLLHFSETVADEGWKLCNVRAEKDGIASVRPKEWQGVKYACNDTLPLSMLQDDSTTIRVTILNYTPEAGRNIEVEMSNLDDGTSKDIYRYDIDENGVAEIRLHPCFPQTLLVGLGKSKKSPVVVVPGKNMEMLMDLGNATDALAAVDFKGAMAETNYKLNVEGWKKMIRYDDRFSHLDSLVRYGKNSLSKEAQMAYDKNEEKISSLPSCAARDILQLMNADAYIFHKKRMSVSAYGMFREYMKGRDVNESLYAGLSSVPFVNERKIIESELLTSRYFTLCPLFFQVMVDQSQGSFNSLTRFMGMDSRTGQRMFNTYNESMGNLFESVRESVFSSEVSEYNLNKIENPELRNYYQTLFARWQEEDRRINAIPHVHFNVYPTKIREDLRNSIMAEYAGKAVVFVRYDMSNVSSVACLNELDSYIAAADPEKVVFVMMDEWHGYPDRNAWLRFVKNRHGEHYGSRGANLNLVYSAYDTIVRDGLFYEVYRPDGTLVVSTKDGAAAKKAIDSLM